MSITQQQIFNFLRQRSIKSRLLGAFSVFAVLAFAVIGSFYWYDYHEERIELLTRRLATLNLRFNELNHLEKDFFQTETINPEFYKTGKSPYLDKHTQGLRFIRQEIKALGDLLQTQVAPVATLLDSLAVQLGNFSLHFDKLVQKIKERGFLDYGLEGEMQGYILTLEKDYPTLDKALILEVRRQEKDFLIRKEAINQRQTIAAVAVLARTIPQQIQDAYTRQKALQSLEFYRICFLKLVQAEREIGLRLNTGLQAKLEGISIVIENNIKTIDQTIFKQADTLRANIKTTLGILLTLLIVLSLGWGYFTVQKLGTPIRRLSDSIQEMIAKNFADEVEIYRIHSQDETAGLSKDIAVLVDTVRLRTQEVLDQKEQISEAYDNIKHLSEIGQHVTANLKIEKMMEVLGKDLAELFDYAFFAIGVPNKHKKRLDFWAMDRNGVQFRFFDGFQEKNLLSVRAFEQNEEILVQNVQAEYTRYFAKQAIPEKYNKYPAQVYLPLNAPHRILGVFTVQAAAVMSYSAYHLSLLHNLAVYISIALENANIYRQLDEKREKLLDSINYAQRIQQAILPKITAIQRVFPDSFVFFQPCDIVSGDFYWYAETEPRAVYEPKIVATDSIRNVFKEVLTPKHVLVAADCTGHGVPGAFMSMIGNDLLNNIIIEQGITAPEVILTKLHEGIRLALKQKENENPDGMDVAICVVDFEQRMLEYAGAFHPLLQIKDGIVQLIRADKKPVGGWYEEREDRVFHKHQITLEGESAFYIFSDGFGHQLGRENRKKFMSINLQKILLDIHHKPMKAQQYILEKVLRYWTGKHRQNDDVLVIGFKIGEKDIARQHNLYADKLQIS